MKSKLVVVQIVHRLAIRWYDVASVLVVYVRTHISNMRKLNCVDIRVAAAHIPLRILKAP